MAKTSYAGKIGSTGAQVVKAPFASGVKTGKGTVKKGDDLRK